MYTSHSTSVIYQADPSWAPLLKQKREALHARLRPYVGRTIRVQTVDGHTHEGVLVNMDGRHIYLQTHESHGMPGYHHDHHRAFYNPASAAILPLVLYELLVIVLLS